MAMSPDETPNLDDLCGIDVWITCKDNTQNWISFLPQPRMTCHGPWYATASIRYGSFNGCLCQRLPTQIYPRTGLNTSIDVSPVLELSSVTVGLRSASGSEYTKRVRKRWKLARNSNHPRAAVETHRIRRYSNNGAVLGDGSALDEAEYPQASSSSRRTTD